MSKFFRAALFVTLLPISFGLSTKLEERGASPVMLQRVEALFKAIEALATDVNDY